MNYEFNDNSDQTSICTTLSSHIHITYQERTKKIKRWEKGEEEETCKLPRVVTVEFDLLREREGGRPGTDSGGEQRWTTVVVNDGGGGKHDGGGGEQRWWTC